MHYIDKGEGPETIVFSHGLLFSSEMFADQIAHFKDHYRCVAFDHRGQGQSPITKDGYDLDTLAEQLEIRRIRLEITGETRNAHNIGGANTKRTRTMTTEVLVRNLAF